MDVLYDVDCVEYEHSEVLVTDDGTKFQSFDVKRSKIDSSEFKQLLVSMPDADHIFYTNKSFKIAKDSDSLRISFFDFQKTSTVKGEKQQLKKVLSIIRFIIKIHSNNFYVSITKFGKRKMFKDIKQNFIRHEDIERFATKLSDLLIYNYKISSNTQQIIVDALKKTVIPQELKKEISKISSILQSELGTTTTHKALTEPNTFIEIHEYFTDLLTGVILEWFCKKNQIKVDYFWLTKLISTQYITKMELKKYDNNYLKAFLDYYKLTPADVPHIKSNIKKYMGHSKRFISLSVYGKLFPIGEYEFNFESSIRLTDQSQDTAPLVDTDTFLNSIYNLSDSHDREEFANFLDYLSANRKSFHSYAVVDKSVYLGSFILLLAKMYRMGVAFNFTYTPDVMHDPAKLTELAEAVNYLAANGGIFTVQHYSQKYKDKIESTFTLYGIKWNVKLHVKPIINESFNNGVVISNNTSVILTDVKTGEFIEMAVTNPKSRTHIRLMVPTESLKNFILNRGKDLFIADDSILKSILADQQFQIIYKVKDIKRKSPRDCSPALWAIQKVFNTFYENARYFNVDNQILYPILGSVIKNNETLNKYTKIKVL